MTTTCSARPGDLLADLDTPAYCVDVDLFDANIARIAEFLRDRGKQWRPHAKCHKSPDVARRQLAAGAIGLTVAKASEAEVFAEAGVQDILIAHMVVGPPKLARVVSLCRRARPIVCCDHYAQAEALSAACVQAGVCCRVLIEINLGMHRVGVRPGPDTLDLANGIDRLPGIELAGIMGYEGHLLTIADADEKRHRIHSAMDVLAAVRDSLQQRGFCCEIVSAGGTGSYQMTADCPAVTEIQAGGGIFADPYYRDCCGVTGLTPALRIVATVVSRPSLERAVLDVGRKAVHWDVHPPNVLSTASGRPLPDATVTRLSAEHGVLELGPGSQDLSIGEKVLLIPGYSDHTTVLYDHLLAVRNGRVAEVWPITARGMLW
jgi:D-serine deaminase-like pyridoxal phosphate-dependent protein